MRYRALLIKIVTFLGGLYFFLEFLLPEEVKISGHTFKFGAYHQDLSVGFQTIGAMAFGLGIINLLMVHGSRIIFKRKGASNSIALLLGLCIMTTVVSLDWRENLQVAAEVKRFFVLRDFSQQIVADAREDTPDVPDVPFRNSKLVEATKSLLHVVEFELTRAESQSSHWSALNRERLLNTRSDVTDSLKRLRESLSGLSLDSPAGSNWQEKNTDAARLLGETGVIWRSYLNQFYEQSTVKGIYSVLFEGLFTALGSAMFSLLGFYIASAAYRAFRIQSMESILMMLAALIVMLGQIPFGIWIYEGFPELRNWLLLIPSAAAFRAIRIGAAIAGLIIAFRMWLSIESETFSDERIDSGEGSV